MFRLRPASRFPGIRTIVLTSCLVTPVLDSEEEEIVNPKAMEMLVCFLESFRQLKEVRMGPFCFNPDSVWPANVPTTFEQDWRMPGLKYESSTFRPKSVIEFDIHSGSNRGGPENDPRILFRQLIMKLCVSFANGRLNSNLAFDGLFSYAYDEVSQLGCLLPPDGIFDEEASEQMDQEFQESGHFYPYEADPCSLCLSICIAFPLADVIAADTQQVVYCSERERHYVGGCLCISEEDRLDTIKQRVEDPKCNMSGKEAEDLVCEVLRKSKLWSPFPYYFQCRGIQYNEPHMEFILEVCKLLKIDILRLPPNKIVDAILHNEWRSDEPTDRFLSQELGKFVSVGFDLEKTKFCATNSSQFPGVVILT